MSGDLPTSMIDDALPAVGVSASGHFGDLVDHDVDAAQSVVLRYRDAVRLEPDDADDAALKQLLQKTSLREGIRAFPLVEYKGVSLDVMDETSLMHTRTLKSIDGCVAAAHCLKRGYTSVVFESGGNTGTALTTYLNKAGIETFLFLPSGNVELLDESSFASDLCRVIAIDDARDVKPTAHAFADRRGIPRIPELRWRMQSSTFIGAFVLEHLLSGARYDVLAQSISAAFGPIGVYRVLDRYAEAIGRPPRFLGVQQSTNSPMVSLWRSGGTQAAPDVASTTGLIAKVMYDSAPTTYGTFELLRDALERTNGDLTTIDPAEFTQRLGTTVDGRTVLEHLCERGLVPAVRDGDILEKAGLMSLVGTLQQIDKGAIEPGSRVLVLITGCTAQPQGTVAASRLVGDEIVDG
jgi:threonine synthase